MAELLRDDQRRLTRDRIVRAVTELVAEGHPAAVSVPAVARRAGVGVATVYRYFPTKEALLDASAGAIASDVTQDAPVPTTFEELESVLPIAWHQISGEHLALARSQLASPLGREIRRRRYEVKEEAMRTALEAIGVGPDSPEGRRLGAVADVLTSSTALLEMHDKAGIPVDDAVAYALWALRTLVDATAATAQEPR